MTASLYLVGTPIGNLEDISARALRVLGEVDEILAEDTRHSRKLLQHFGIRTPLSAWHAHNEEKRLQAVLDRLAAGASLALVSDAGMPLISDPGFPLVRAAREAGFAVECVPGPTALTTALVLSGLPAERFVFEGFLPAKAAARREQLASFANESKTVIFYESTHRIRDSLLDMRDVLGAERRVCVARELTKRFETVRTASLGQWCDGLDEGEWRGEFVVLLDGVERVIAEHALQASRVMQLLSEELPPRKAAKLTAKLCGGKANDYYGQALAEPSA